MSEEMCVRALPGLKNGELCLCRIIDMPGHRVRHVWRPRGLQAGRSLIEITVRREEERSQLATSDLAGRQRCPVLLSTAMGGGPAHASTAIRNPPGNARQIPVARFAYCAGMVINGSCSVPPVPESVKKNMTAVIARFVKKSLSSIQNQ